MIVRTPNDWSADLMEQFQENLCPRPTLHDTYPSRPSEVLGPDGEPVSVDLPRRRMGFILPHEGREAAET